MPTFAILLGLAIGAQGRASIHEPASLGPAARSPQPYARERVDAGFALSDRDANGWLSFRELRATLHCDRSEFQVYDSDGDGFVSPEEFQVHVRRLLENGALLPLPMAGAASPPPSAPAASSPGAESRPAGGVFRFGDIAASAPAKRTPSLDDLLRASRPAPPRPPAPKLAPKPAPKPPEPVKKQARRDVQWRRHY